MRAPVEDRFWLKVDRRSYDECWPWQASIYTHTRTGLSYGRFRLNEGELERHRSTQKAHRVAFRLLYERWPENALHGCDNPVCCNAENPAHVHEGTVLQNNREMQERGRYRSHGKPPLTMEQCREIRARYGPGGIVSQAALGLEYGVSQFTISWVIRTGRGG